MSKGEGNPYPYDVIEINFLKKKWMGKDLRLMLSNLLFYKKCKYQFKKNKPHFIYARYHIYGWAGIKLARKFSIPIIMHVDDLRVEIEKDRLHFPKLAETFETAFLKRVDAICCPSKILKSLIIEKGVDEQKIFVTPNGINLDEFNNNSDGKEIRKRFGLEGKLIVGYVGVFTRLWGIYTILESAQKVLCQRKDIHFVLVGQGRAFPEVETFIKDEGLGDRFTLTGSVAHSEVPKYISAMDIGLAPYEHLEPFYGSPMKIFEYMAMSKPVITTPQGQIKDLIAHGENGLLVAPNDPVGLAKAIMELIDNKDMMRNMGLKARATAESYTWEANARKILDTYRSLVNGKTGSVYEN
jgi:glycosyltransferase involved in cell wall biosynthesis